MISEIKDMGEVSARDVFYLFKTLRLICILLTRDGIKAEKQVKLLCEHILDGLDTFDILGDVRKGIRSFKRGNRPPPPAGGTSVFELNAEPNISNMSAHEVYFLFKNMKEINYYLPGVPRKSAQEIIFQLGRDMLDWLEGKQIFTDFVKGLKCYNNGFGPPPIDVHNAVKSIPVRIPLSLIFHILMASNIGTKTRLNIFNRASFRNVNFRLTSSITSVHGTLDQVSISSDSTVEILVGSSLVPSRLSVPLSDTSLTPMVSVSHTSAVLIVSSKTSSKYISIPLENSIIPVPATPDQVANRVDNIIELLENSSLASSRRTETSPDIPSTSVSSKNGTSIVSSRNINIPLANSIAPVTPRTPDLLPNGSDSTVEILEDRSVVPSSSSATLPNVPSTPDPGPSSTRDVALRTNTRSEEKIELTQEQLHKINYWIKDICQVEYFDYIDDKLSIDYGAAGYFAYDADDEIDY